MDRFGLRINTTDRDPIVIGGLFTLSTVHIVIVLHNSAAPPNLVNGTAVRRSRKYSSSDGAGRAACSGGLTHVRSTRPAPYFMEDLL